MNDSEIIQGLRRWENSPAYKRIPWNTQTGRVIKVLAGTEWMTLRDIEAKIAVIYPEDRDTQAAISARIREVSPSRHGLVKQKYMEMVNKKQVWRYRLVPTTPVREVAQKIGVAA
ncbi:hypothetical protein SBX64_15955 [Vibrio rhizosphaerae]|uniref:Uncharacterized protein n=1 Tax=Vibrio rhizosphaerae TaxID=398736 RepID=A0ABU4IXY3_9VIBR|nr:hypothetical protein [Vibrio rhizosphaerae]MDW6094033.1 hypothetical protein [Vibrio rhizosphaerae]